ncbi:MAG: hypothetical protein ACK421_07705 [Pseudanabaenaceae cyanobacterium]
MEEIGSFKINDERFLEKGWEKCFYRKHYKVFRVGEKIFIGATSCTLVWETCIWEEENPELVPWEEWKETMLCDLRLGCNLGKNNMEWKQEIKKVLEENGRILKEDDKILEEIMKALAIVMC